MSLCLIYAADKLRRNRAHRYSPTPSNPRISGGGAAVWRWEPSNARGGGTLQHSRVPRCRRMRFRAGHS